MTIRTIELLPHQLEFIKDTKTRFLALCGGFGSGKTKCLAVKTITLAALNTGTTAGLFSATYELASSILIPAMDEHLEEYKIPFDFKGSPHPRYVLKFPHGETEVLIKSFENWKRIIGNNYSFACVDEIDTVDVGVAAKAWDKLLGRIRVGKVCQIAVASTPEGFKTMYRIWVKESTDPKTGQPKSDRRLIRARSTDNPFLDEDFIPSLMENYSAELVKAYINGEFVNLTSGTVYSSFDRHKNHTDEVVQEGDRLHIGMDFNVGQMAAVVHIIDQGLPRAVDEFIGLEDTPAMIRAIQTRYGHHPEIYIYPDASGNARKSVNASESDIALLRLAAFRVEVDKANPPVKDRINAMNAAFCNAAGDRRYLVNTTMCPRYTEALEQQVWVNGEPDKTGTFSHCVDAAGYYISRTMPIKAIGHLLSGYLIEDW